METNFKIIEEVLSLRKSLADANAELNAIKAKKSARALSSKRSKKINPEEKRVGAVLRASSRKLKSQVYQDSKTLNRIIMSKLQEEEKHTFFLHVNKRIAVLVGLDSFKKTCSDFNLDPQAVAQHVVVRGAKAMNLVFKDGLNNVYDKEKLKLYNEPIFDTVELDMSRYRPLEHADSSID